MKKHTIPNAATRPYKPGDEIDVDGQETTRAKVVATFHHADGSQLIIYSRTSSTGTLYVAADAGAVTLQREAGRLDRFSHIPNRTLDEWIATDYEPDCTSYAPQTLDEMRGSLWRITRAMELLRRAADLIRAPRETATSIGWDWTEEDQTAARAVALCEFADHELDLLLSGCVSTIAQAADEDEGLVTR